MDNTAQNNGINLTYPTFNDGITPQPTTAPQDTAQNNVQLTPLQDLGYGDFQGNIDTSPVGTIKDGLDEIMPDPKKPKALERTPTSNSLAEPMGTKNKRESEYLITPKDESKDIQPPEPVEQIIEQEISDEGAIGVLDLGTTPPPDTIDNPDLDTTMPEISVKKDNENIQKDPVVGMPANIKITELLEYTIEKGASDLHISVGYPAIIRVDGELEEVSENIIDPMEAEELILPLLSDDKRELLEVNKEIDFAYTHEGRYKGRFRINAFYAMKTLSAAFRLIPSRVRTVEELKLPQIYHQFTKLRQGMILVTGPTGHGKSTTLAAMLEDINRNKFYKIVTIEDPVEYVFEGKKSLIDQREMGQDTHSWPIALKSAMRQDPDVILVGEMRDYETISAAITLAETGHLVFATLHTNNSAQSIDRMIDVFPEEQQSQVRAQLSNILEVVIAQRLIPLDHGGRRAVAEILLINPAVKNLIREGKTYQVDNVIRTSSDIGMVSLERSLVDLVREGVISIKTAQEYAVYPEEVSRLLKS